MRLPTFLIIGAAKAGTGTLYAALRQHPDVFMPLVKEPHFFSFLAGAARRSVFIPDDVLAFSTIDDYATLFDDATDAHRAIGEASTGYLCQPGAAEAIRAHLPQVRLIVLLRDPSERAWSDYRMSRQYGLAEGDFATVCDAQPGILSCGEYARLLNRYLEVFPREQLRVYLTEELANDPQAVVASVCMHIGVDPIHLRVERRNVGTIQQPLPPDLRGRLIEHYGSDIRALEEMLRRDLSRWMEVPTGDGIEP